MQGGRRTYLGQGVRMTLMFILRTWMVWVPVVILGIVVISLTTTASEWPSFLANHEAYTDCTVTSVSGGPGGLAVGLILRAGGVAYNTSAVYDYAHAGLFCHDTDGEYVEKVAEDIGVGDRMTCWVKKQGGRGGGANLGSPGWGPVYVFPTLIEYCFYQRALPMLVIAPILALFYLIGMAVYAWINKDAVDAPWVAAFWKAVGYVWAYVWVLFYAAGVIVFFSLLLSIVIWDISVETTCTIHAKGRRVECLKCWNKNDGNKLPAQARDFCGTQTMCTGSGGSGLSRLDPMVSLYDAWVDVEYSLPGDSVVYRVEAREDVQSSIEEDTTSFDKGLRERVAPYLAAIAVNSTIPCYVSAYGPENKVNLAGRRPEESNRYVLALTFMLLIPSILFLNAICICCRRNHCPRWCYLDAWDPNALHKEGSLSDYDDYTYFSADDTGTTTYTYDHPTDDATDATDAI